MSGYCGTFTVFTEVNKTSFPKGKYTFIMYTLQKYGCTVKQKEYAINLPLGERYLSCFQLASSCI